MFEGVGCTPEGSVILLDHPEWSSLEDVQEALGLIGLGSDFSVRYDRWHSFYLVPTSSQDLTSQAAYLSDAFNVPVEVGTLHDAYV